MAGEIAHIEILLELADRVKSESRIEEIIKVIESDFPNEKIVFFTEYKATQAEMIKALRKYFPDCKTVFINGDNAINCCGLNEKSDRFRAMQAFNERDAKYLVSTEASGEGVDLQSNCHVLIHVDLPWNPMRLHQRVGRLYRYGQKEDVDVLTFRNPGNLEGMIWEKLETKLDTIRDTMGYVMDDPEDMKQMVLGIEDENFYSHLFAEGTRISKKESFDDWFDEKTQRMGNKSALEVIRGIEEHAQRFDLSSLNEVPRLKQELLYYFVTNLLRFDGEKFQQCEYGITLTKPKEWEEFAQNRRQYRNQNGPFIFNREDQVKNKNSLFAIGDPVCDAALCQARDFIDNYAEANIPYPLLIFKVFDRDTTSNSLSNYCFVGYFNKGNEYESISQVELLKLITGLLDKGIKKEMTGRVNADGHFLDECKKRAIKDYISFGIDYSLPESEVFAYIVPSRKGE